MRSVRSGLLASLCLCAASFLAAAATASVRDGAFLGIRAITSDGRVTVSSVTPDSAAERAGLQEGDVIVAFGDARITSGEELSAALAGYDAGDTIEVSIEREGEAIAKTLTLGSHPSGNVSTLSTEVREPARRASGGSGGFLGVLLEDGDAVKGAHVTDTVPGSPAEAAGLRAGDTITAVGDVEIESRSDAVNALGARRAGERVKITLERDGETVNQEITLADRAEAEARMGAPASEPAAGSDEPPAATRGWFGIYLRNDDGRLIVDRTVDDGPAAKAGLQAGDVIISIDGQEVGDSDALAERLDASRPGQSVRVEVLRGDKVEKADVLLGEMPSTASTMEQPPVRAPGMTRRPGAGMDMPMTRMRLGAGDTISGTVEQDDEGRFFIRLQTPQGQRILQLGDAGRRVIVIEGDDDAISVGLLPSAFEFPRDG